MPRSLNLFLKLAPPAIVFLVVAYIAHSFDLERIKHILIEMNTAWLLPLCGLLPAMLSIQATKWLIVIKDFSINVPFREALRMTMVGFYFGAATPAQSGALIKCELLRRASNKNWQRCYSSVLLDKAGDLFVLCCLGVTSFLYYLNIFSNPWFYPLVFLGVYTFAVVLLWQCRNQLSKVPILGPRLQTIVRLMPSAKTIFRAQLLSIMLFVAIYSQAFCVLSAIAPQIPIVNWLVALPLASLVALIPVTFHGLGTRDVALWTLLQEWKVEPETIFAFTVSNLLLTVYIPAVLVAIVVGILNLGRNQKAPKALEN